MSNRQKNNSDLCAEGCLISLGVIFVLASLTLPIVILSYTENFKTEITCMPKFSNATITTISVPIPQNSSNITNMIFAPTTLTPTNLATPTPTSSHTNLAYTIGIYPWMIVHGAIGIVEAINIIIYIVTSFLWETECGVYSWVSSLCFLILLVFFRFSWLVVGAVMFWRDCPNLYPSQMNDLMWATLIIGFIGLWSTVGTSIGGKYNGASRAENNYKISRAGVYRV